jgi:kynurenine formamidase
MTTAPPLAANTPTNWGRWGTDDELGTLNFVTDAARVRGVAEARDARVVSLAATVAPVPLAGPIPFGVNPMPAGVLQMMNFTGSPAIALTDVLVVNTHHAALTHIDALVHIPTGDQVYPGIGVNSAVAGGTVRQGSTAAFAAGVVTRGVFLDLAPGGRLDVGTWVDAADLEAAEQRAGVRVESGDALVVRGGWTQGGTDPTVAIPAMTTGAVEWMAEREVAVYAGDIGDRSPFLLPPGAVLAMHQIALGQLGMPLIDCVEVAPLAAACQDLGRYSFLFVLAPMALLGATGVPVNPLAIF